MFLLLFSIIITHLINNNEAENVSENCKVMYSSGYGYSQFINVKEQDLPNGDELFIKFSVCAQSDAHILLSPIVTPSDTDSVYEIVLGAGKNKFSDIRRQQKAHTKSTVSTPDILSSIDLKQFWIKITNNGIIQVGKDGSDMPFIFWHDPQPLTIRYYSFGTWPGVMGKWLYECPANEKETSHSNSSEQVLTTTNKLRRDIFTNYNPIVTPSWSVNIPMDVEIYIICWNIQLDIHDFTMTSYGQMSVVWADTRLSWISSNYENMTWLAVHNSMIWKPDIILHNSIDKETELVDDDSSITITSEGMVRLDSKFHTKTTCDINLKNWPSDSHTCDIVLSTSSNSTRLIPFRDFKTSLGYWTTSNEWQIIQNDYEIQQMKNGQYDKSPSGIKLKIELKRKSYFYITILYTAFLLTSSMPLLSFFLSPNSFHKILINCLAFIFIIIFLLVAQSFLPSFTSETPTLLMGYCWMTIICGISMTCAFISIYVSRFPMELPFPDMLHRTTVNPVLRKLLFLPSIRPQVLNEELEGYYDIPSVSSYCLWKGSKDTVNGIKDEWIKFINIFDRISFIISFVLILIIFNHCLF